MNEESKEYICNLDIKQNLGYLYNCALGNTNYINIGKTFCFDNITNYIVNIKKENTQLKQQVDECKEFATTYERELLAIIKCKGIEITKLQQQLKDKDEKISEVTDIIKIMQSNFIDNNACFVDYDDYLWELKNLLEILESNKED